MSADGVARYQAFLLARDGEADFARHTLSRREALFARLAETPVRAAAPVDRDAYLRNLRRRRPEAGLDARTLWLLATAKANQAERFGVGLGELYGLVREDDPVRLHISLQETYHTRILADVVGMFGLPVPAMPPPLFARAIIRVIVSLPEARHLPLTGCAEMAGCVIFRVLRDRGVALSADEPAVADRIRLLYDEILADEIGHVGFIAALVSPMQRRLMRALYRVLAPRMAGALPELVALVGRDELARRFAAPFELDTMAAELPGLAYAAAAV